MNPAAGGQNTPQDASDGGPVSGGRDTAQERLAAFIRSRAPLNLARNLHRWRGGVRKHQPVMECERCPVVWWPDRSEPKSRCDGGPCPDEQRQDQPRQDEP